MILHRITPWQIFKASLKVIKDKKKTKIVKEKTNYVDI